MNSNFPIIIVDDEKDARLTLAGALKVAGFTNTVQCESGDEIMPILQEHKSGIVLLDLNMPGKSGQEVLPEIVTAFPEVAVIIVTCMNDIDTAVKCIKEGAFDYLVKPLKTDRLIKCIRHATDIYNLRFEIVRIRERFFERTIENPNAFSAIITGNDRMLSIFNYCEAISVGNQPVLITGETGTGKELIAEAIHRLSGRKGKFVAVNIAGLDVNMLSDALFGHTKGAFTGANQSREGLVEEAAEGTLFLDEIGDLDRNAQIKLLRLLQEHEYLPVGSTRLKSTDVRIVTATHMDLDELVEKGTFRKDLYYRLTTHHIHIPPLKERPDDIGTLLDFFLEEAAGEFKKKRPTYPPELISLLKTYHFPGNIRELRSMVFDAVSAHRSRKLSMRKFREKIKKQRSKKQVPETPEKEIIFPAALPTIKKCVGSLVIEALKRSGHNQKIAAESLGISQQALNKRLHRGKTVQVKYDYQT